MIQVVKKATQDGTYTVYVRGKPIAWGPAPQPQTALLRGCSAHRAFRNWYDRPCQRKAECCVAIQWRGRRDSPPTTDLLPPLLRG
jgi:hypothetical protein